MENILDIEEMSEKASKRMREIRNSLVISKPFFGALTLNLEPVEDTTIDTMAVDGESVFYNPKGLLELPFDQSVTAHAHEDMHCALGHHARRGNREINRWNRSCDYEINPLLLDDGFAEIPGWLLRDDYRGLSAETIYTRETALDEDRTQEEIDELDEAAERLGKVLDGPGNGTEFDPNGKPVPSPASPSELANQASEWEVRVMQAAAAAKANGQLTGAAKWLVDQIKKPRINWIEVVRDFMQSISQSDTSWTRVNRRLISQGVYMPSHHSREMGEIAVVVDCSGSIGRVMLEAFSSELNGILDEIKPTMTHVLFWDTECKGYTSYESDDYPVSLESTGGGGTSFEGIWQHVRDLDISPDCLVCLTDLEVYQFGDEPEYPVLWCSTQSTKAPFGDVVSLTL